MKKIFIIFAILATTSSSAFAKTEGDYFSANALYNRATFNQGASGAPVEKSTNGSGAEIGYKHAFSFDKFFIAPGVFAEKNNIKTSVNSTNISIKNRYGVKADFGYDLEDDLAVYLVGGLSFLNYRTENTFGNREDNARSSFFYGLGLKQDYSEKVSFNLEYNTQSFAAKSADSNKIITDNNTVKIGLNYKF